MVQNGCVARSAAKKCTWRAFPRVNREATRPYLSNGDGERIGDLTRAAGFDPDEARRVRFTLFLALDRCDTWASSKSSIGSRLFGHEKHGASRCQLEIRRQRYLLDIHAAKAALRLTGIVMETEWCPWCQSPGVGILD
jgi:hypothetical protein